MQEGTGYMERRSILALTLIVLAFLLVLTACGYETGREHGEVVNEWRGDAEDYVEGFTDSCPVAILPLSMAVAVAVGKGLKRQ
jgi:hypothetical protein